jgi:uncharacterized protein
MSTNPSSFPTHYTKLNDLAQLPWFGLKEDRLVVEDDSVGPIIDMHTHLALSFLAPPRVDLTRATGPTAHYLDIAAPFDLDRYANKNFTKADLRAIRKDMTINVLTAGGMRATHTTDNLKREMKELAIKHSVLLPIDFPRLSRNAESYLEASVDDPALISFGSVHPYASNVRAKLAAQKRAGIRGLKLHPMAQMVAPDNVRCLRLCRHCNDLGVPILFHCGPVGIEPKSGKRRCQVYRYEKVIAENPDLPVILGHSGALQMEEALSLSLRYSNVWLELSSQGLPGIRKLIDKTDPERLLYGSDWPFYHQALPLAKILIATEGDPGLRSKILWKNAARLLSL